MSCELAQTTVHGYFDGELDAVRSAEFEAHLEICQECQAELARAESLRATLQKSDLYEHASLQLRERVRKQLGQGAGFGRMRGWGRRRWFFLPAFAGLAAIAAGLIVALLLLPAQRQSTRITAALVDAHVRSLQPGHLTDVVSSDQHTVKPWFDGKLDFIPPVSAYAAQGFPLLGGRLDVVDLHNVAALVYGRRKHVINLFIWPARDAPRLSDNSGTRQGYHWLTWQADDMQYCLVSDVAPGDLRELEELLRSSGATAIPH